MIEWKLFEVKQHKYKLVLGWVTIWVVLLIRRQKACYDYNINQEPNARRRILRILTAHPCNMIKPVVWVGLVPCMVSACSSCVSGWSLGWSPCVHSVDWWDTDDNRVRSTREQSSCHQCLLSVSCKVVVSLSVKVSVSAQRIFVIPPWATYWH